MKLATTTPYRLIKTVAGVTGVEIDGEIIGYVQKAGTVFVTLAGAVYNTSTEIGQSLDRETAVQLLVDH